MLTLSRAGSAITCRLVDWEETEACRSVQRLTRSLQVTASESFDLRDGLGYRNAFCWVHFGLGILVQAGR